MGVQGHAQEPRFRPADRFRESEGPKVDRDKRIENANIQFIFDIHEASSEGASRRGGPCGVRRARESVPAAKGRLPCAFRTPRASGERGRHSLFGGCCAGFLPQKREGRISLRRMTDVSEACRRAVCVRGMAPQRPPARNEIPPCRDGLRRGGTVRCGPEGGPSEIFVGRAG